MTSSTKSEAYKILHWRQRRTWPQITGGTEDLVKYGRVVFEILNRD